VRPFRAWSIALAYAALFAACTNNFDVFSQPSGDAGFPQDATLDDSSNAGDAVVPDTSGGNSPDAMAAEDADDSAPLATDATGEASPDTAADAIDSAADGDSSGDSGAPDSARDALADVRVDAPADAGPDSPADARSDGASCGGKSQACCAPGNLCAVGRCVGTTCQCGAQGQVCCPTAPKCVTGPCSGGGTCP
jgi:hypothetical protein